MMKYTLVASILAGVLFSVVACSGDSGAEDGLGGATGGQGTGGKGTGGKGTGGQGTGGSQQSGGAAGDTSLGGLGGMTGVSCTVDGPSGLGGVAGGSGASLSISGSYTDQYQGSYTIDATTVDSGFSVTNIMMIDEDEQFLVGQNDETNAYFPCDYSRFDWHEEGGKLYLCQTAYAAASASEAAVTPAADASDLSSGCGGFPWSELTPD